MSALYAVILAGGSGTRFWPASRRMRPKQLLSLAPTRPESLIAATRTRVEGLVRPQAIVVSTGAHLLEQTRAALPGLPESAFLAEPYARNTAPAIAWATQHIALEDPDAVAVVMPSDHFVEDEQAFRSALGLAVAQAKAGYITTLGIAPTRPETGYGYIEQGAATDGGAHVVARFVEKPDEPTARAYLESGNYLWNAGIFVYPVGKMLQAIEQHLPEMGERLRLAADQIRQHPGRRQVELEQFFEAAPSISIDYAVMEHESDLRVVPCNAGWNDLGSWQALWEISPKDEQGNAASERAMLVNCEGNLVIDLEPGDERPLIAMLGVQDLCVVRTRDALLIMPRANSQQLRELVAAVGDRGLQDLL